MNFKTSNVTANIDKGTLKIRYIPDKHERVNISNTHGVVLTAFHPDRSKEGGVAYVSHRSVGCLLGSGKKAETLPQDFLQSLKRDIPCLDYLQVTVAGDCYTKEDADDPPCLSPEDLRGEHRCFREGVVEILREAGIKHIIQKWANGEGTLVSLVLDLKTGEVTAAESDFQ